MLYSQELQDQCTTLRGAEEKRSSMQSQMISLQQQLDTYKSTLAEKQQKNEQLQNKLTKVPACLCGEYIRVCYCMFCAFRLKGVAGMPLHKRRWNLLALARQIKRHWSWLNNKPRWRQWLQSGDCPAHRFPCHHHRNQLSVSEEMSIVQ